MAATLTTTVVPAPTKPQIFAGKSFFVSVKIPSYATFKKDIQEHGGIIRQIEGVQDYKIGDHVRKPPVTGFLSYTFIEAAVKSGQLPNPADHEIKIPVQPISRGVGRQKSTRTAFTDEDDFTLIEFVWRQMRSKKMGNIGPKGNKIYSALATLDPRHTTHSWRDRYINFTPEYIAHIEAQLKEDSSSQESDIDPAEPPTRTIQTPRVRQSIPQQVQNNPRQNSQQSLQRAQTTRQDAQIMQSDGAHDLQENASEGPEQTENEPILNEEERALADAVFEQQPIDKTTGQPFTLNEIEHVVLAKEHIDHVDSERVEEAWQAFSIQLEETHAAWNWASLYYDIILPTSERLKEEKLANLPRTSSLPTSRPDFQRITTSPRPASASPSRKRRRISSPEIAAEVAIHTNQPPGIHEMDEDEVEQSNIDQQLTSEIPHKVQTTRQAQPSDERLQWQFDQALHKKNMQSSAQFVPESSPHPLTMENLESQTSQQSQLPNDDKGYAQRKAEACMQYVRETTAHSVLSTHDQRDRESVSSKGSSNSSKHSGKNTIPTSYQPPRKSSPLSQEIQPDDYYESEHDPTIGRAKPTQNIAHTTAGAKKRTYDLMRQDIGSQHLTEKSALPASSEESSPAKSYSLASSYEPDLSVPSPPNYDLAHSRQDDFDISTSHEREQTRIASTMPLPQKAKLTSTPLRSTAARVAAVQSTTSRRRMRGSLMPTHESSSEQSSPIIQASGDNSPLFVAQDSMGQEEPMLFATEDSQDSARDMPLSSQSPKVQPRRSSPRQASIRLSNGQHQPSQPLNRARTPSRPVASNLQKQQAKQIRLPSKEVDVINISSTSDDGDSSDAFEPIKRKADVKKRRSLPWNAGNSPAMASRRTAVQNTQAILALDTQAVDTDVPEPAMPANNNHDYMPDYGDAYEVQDNTATPTSVPDQYPTSLAGTNKAEDVEDFVDRMTNNGYDTDDVIDALQKTSMVTRLAEAILLKAKHNLPYEHLPGVWTKHDDEILQEGDARKMRELELKHGADRFNERMNFLQDYNDEDEDD